MASTSGSFIPKRSTGKVTPVRSGRQIYILSYVAYVFFFGTLIAVIGIFILNQQSKNTLNEYIQQVNAQRQANLESQIETVRTLDTHLQLAERILDWHVAPSILFGELEQVLVETIQLDKFSYKRETGGAAEISFGGAADSFDVLLFQREVMESSDFFGAAEITEVSYGSESTEVIQGANRSGSSDTAASDGNNEVATISFGFSDDTIVEHIGYEPRVDADNETNIDSNVGSGQ